MKNLLKISAVLIVSAFITVSCATTGSMLEVKDTIAPKRSYEECFELLMGQTLDYSFTSSRPLDFNIHYHSMDGVKYPVDEKNIREQKGEFVCNEQKFYTEDQEAFCMMWTNNDNAFVNLELKYKVRPDR